MYKLTDIEVRYATVQFVQDAIKDLNLDDHCIEDQPTIEDELDYYEAALKFNDR